MQLIRLGAPEVGPKGAQVGLGCIYVCEGVYVCVCARASIGEEMKLLYRLRMVAMVKIKKKTQQQINSSKNPPPTNTTKTHNNSLGTVRPCYSYQ